MLCCLSIIQELPQDLCSHLFTKMPREIVYLPPVGSWKRLKIHCGLSKTLTLRRSLPSKQSSKKQKAEKELSKTSFSWLISLFRSRGQSRCLAPGIHKWMTVNPESWAMVRHVPVLVNMFLSLSLCSEQPSPTYKALLCYSQLSYFFNNNALSPQWCFLTSVICTLVEARTLYCSTFTSWPCGYLIVL